MSAIRLMNKTEDKTSTMITVSARMCFFLSLHELCLHVHMCTRSQVHDLPEPTDGCQASSLVLQVSSPAADRFADNETFTPSVVEVHAICGRVPLFYMVI